MASPLPIEDNLPAEVRAAREKAHAHLEAQLQFFWEQRVSGQLFVEVSLDRGVPRDSTAYHQAKAQLGGREAMLQASRRRGR